MNIIDYFYEISEIPRKTLDEKEISNFIKAIAIENGYKVVQDEIYNLIIEIPSNNGSDKTIIIQSHLDMVYDSIKGAPNYEDGIRILNEDGLLRAYNTTLGADNGVGVAMMIKILESSDISHPNLLVIFTVQEEVGLVGANYLDLLRVKADYMINLDSEDEGKFTIGCAGGMRNNIEVHLELEELEFEFFVELKCEGFSGGHSGLEINKNIPSAIESMTNLLVQLNNSVDYSIIEINAPGSANAISRVCNAKIGINRDYKKLLIEVDRMNSYLKSISVKDNPHIKIIKNEGQKAFSLKNILKDRILELLSNLPQGVLKMSSSIENLVQTSSNVGIINMNKESIIITSSTRSSVEYEKNILKNRINLLAKNANGSVEFFGEYPAWEIKKSTYLQKVFMEEYKQLFGLEGELIALHAGLECAIFNSKIDNIDAISIGPNLSNVHTINESAEIASIERTWNLLKSVINRL